MGLITKDVLAFVEDAKQCFEENENQATFRDEDLGYIALRWGLHERAIRVYKLGETIGTFADWIERKKE